MRSLHVGSQRAPTTTYQDVTTLSRRHVEHRVDAVVSKRPADIFVLKEKLKPIAVQSRWQVSRLQMPVGVAVVFSTHVGALGVADGWIADHISH